VGAFDVLQDIGGFCGPDEGIWGLVVAVDIVAKDQGTPWFCATSAWLPRGCADGTGETNSVRLGFVNFRLPEMSDGSKIRQQTFVVEAVAD
jgi:hypothetical protein